LETYQALNNQLKKWGYLIPITLRPNGHKDDKKPYELVCGHRRYKSFEELNILQIPSNIRKLTDEEAFHIAFIDNKERENHNPIDEARHYKKAQEDYDLSTRKLAEKYGDSREYYRIKLSLLDLPDDVTTQVVNGQLSETHCRHICKLLNKDKLQKKFVELYHICYKTCRHNFLIFVKTISYYDRIRK
jgi:ParB family chromosome partitioning protein